MQDMANREEQFRLDARAYTATVGTGGLAITVPGDVSSNYTPITPTAKSITRLDAKMKVDGSGVYGIRE